jgi:hypothetical protein
LSGELPIHGIFGRAAKAKIVPGERRSLLKPFVTAELDRILVEAVVELSGSSNSGE